MRVIRRCGSALRASSSVPEAGKTSMDGATTDVPGSPCDIRPILIGAEAPDVDLTTVNEDSCNLNVAIARTPTLLLFYRGGWSPECGMQLAQVQEIKPQLDELGYRIIALSPDGPSRLRKTVEKLGLEYDLLSDSKMAAACAFGIAFQVGGSALARYRKTGVDLEEWCGERHHMLPVPAVFIVGIDGRIRFEYVNPDESVRPTPGMLLVAAKMTLG